MKIIIDAMGGDNAPAEILRGAADAVAELGVEILAVGDQKVILACAAEHNIPLQGIQILQASQAIEMCEEPAKAVRTKKDSSLVVGLKALAEGQGDAFVSAGSTGAPAWKSPICCWTAAPTWSAALPCSTPSVLWAACI